MNNYKSYRSNNYQSLKCIWMASQVVEYKLCDNNFDCENCQFDKVMTNLFNDQQSINNKSNIAQVIAENLNRIRFDNQIIYLKNNLVAKKICSDTFYLGLNPIFISFLDDINSVSFTECKKEIAAGQEIIQISGDWGVVSVSAPMNLLIHDIPGDPTSGTFKSQWIAIMGTTDQEIEKGKLFQAEWEKLRNTAINIVEEIKTQIPQVGQTMMDGGNQIRFLHQLVGKSKYLKILNSLISF